MPLNRPLPARGHDSPQPQSCLLSTHNEPDMAGRRPLAILTSHRLGHNLAPLTGQQRSLLVAPWVTLSALHTTQYRGKPEAAAWQGGAGTEAGELLLGPGLPSRQGAAGPCSSGVGH